MKIKELLEHSLRGAEMTALGAVIPAVITLTGIAYVPVLLLYGVPIGLMLGLGAGWFVQEKRATTVSSLLSGATIAILLNWSGSQVLAALDDRRSVTPLASLFLFGWPALVALLVGTVALLIWKGARWRQAQRAAQSPIGR